MHSADDDLLLKEEHGPRAHLPTLFQRPDIIRDPLYVVTVVFNSARFRTRWKLYQDFERHLSHSPAAVLYTAEVAFGEREFAITRPDNPRHLQLRTRSELWLKERALNLLVQRLPADWKYVATIDADISFARKDWADETRHVLQHTPVVQMWSEAIDLTHGHEISTQHRSFVYSMANPDEAPQPKAGPGGYYLQRSAYHAGPAQIVWWHPGYAWAYTRAAWDGLGGLIDTAILGAADNHMAWGLYDNIERTIAPTLHPRYQQILRGWQTNADRAIRGNVGYMQGSVLHYWHGPKAKRRYADRGTILERTQYNPDVDLRRDSQGLWQLTERSRMLRDLVRRYFAERDEDANA